MNRWDATEVFRTLINSVAKDGRIFYHGRYVELKSSTLRASIKIDDSFDSIKGSREYDFEEGMKFSSESDFIKAQRAKNYTIIRIESLLSIYNGRPLKKSKSKSGLPLSLTPTKLLLKDNNLVVTIIHGDDVLKEQKFFSNTEAQDVVEVVVSSHCFQKILAFSSKICDKIGLRILDNCIQVVVKNKDVNILWQLPRI